ncbi:interleukin-13 receptor subunit alpha-1 [Tupaia chinensis]|uniref:interleukin-13 receptor subunit alpha-1 n=1 Tax=Tupaia chinensis TaxID=246437 RepID=UPI0003C91663|nr:interleukin-13 receptor subunit alpha-1 [Tupaia chinensis]
MISCFLFGTCFFIRLNLPYYQLSKIPFGLFTKAQWCYPLFGLPSPDSEVGLVLRTLESELMTQGLRGQEPAARSSDSRPGLFPVDDPVLASSRAQPLAPHRPGKSAGGRGSSARRAGSGSRARTGPRRGGGSSVWSETGLRSGGRARFKEKLQRRTLGHIETKALSLSPIAGYSYHPRVIDEKTQERKETQPPVTNLSVSIENLCTVTWTWNPPEGTSPNCSLWYFSHFGDKQDKEITLETHRSKEVPLNERICLQVGSQCSTNESEKPSILVEKCISPPEGDPESAVTELQCVWHNLGYMKCSWLPGRNTSPDTNYTLYYWHSSLGKILQCEKIYREGQHIACSFDLTKVKDSGSEQHSIQIMVKDNAGKIRPSFNLVPLTSRVKPDPPHIKNLSFQNGDLYVQWENPQNFKSKCLAYEVEVNNSQTETSDTYHVKEAKCQNLESERNTKDTICFTVPGAFPDTLYTVRIKVKTNKLCYEDNKLWSNWSQAKSIGEKPNSTLYIIMLLLIPVIVAGAVIVLLLYLKRLKIIIFPPIPDPGKIFKEMFGDQNDDTLHWKKYDIYEKQSKEETDSVVLIENLKKAPQ